jgi:DNA-binding response OmpR family regulator/signal transduction histidine kinase
MSANKDRILIVENDPVISDFIGRQALSSAGYQVYTVSDVTSAITKILQTSPDLIICDINLPGLSGKDLMVALTAQGIETPVIVIAPEGKEAEVIQTFRLGASDYLTWPMREAEILWAAERILKQVHEQRNRGFLERKLKDTNQQLQQRVRELTAIFSMGKAVTSITDQKVLFNKIIQVACQVSYGDLGWFLMREEEKPKTFVLVAQHQLPGSMLDNLQQAWDDGISSLVAMSGETLSMHGEPIKRFRVKTLGKSIIIVPIKVQRQVMGILVVMRTHAQPFTESEQHLLEAVADYASISLVNSRLFRAIEARAHALEDLAKRTQYGEKITQELLNTVHHHLLNMNTSSQIALDDLTQDPTARWNPNQRKLLTQLQEGLQDVNTVSQTIITNINSQPDRHTDLSGMVKDMGTQFLPQAQKYRLQLVVEVPNHPIPVDVEFFHLSEMIKGLISNALQYCLPQGIIRLHVTQLSNTTAQLTVSNSGAIAHNLRDTIFRKKSQEQKQRSQRFGGIGISLELIRELIILYDGKISIDQTPDNGTAFRIQLPLSQKMID